MLRNSYQITLCTSSVFSMKIIDYAIEGETELRIHEWISMLQRFQAQNVGSEESVSKGIVPLTNSNFIFPSSALRMDYTQEWLLEPK